jgi:hypothetical protein
MDAADVLSLVVGLLFLVTGGVKVIGLEQSLAVRDHLGVRPPAWRVIGVLECAGAVGALLGLAAPFLGRLALVGLGALMVGALVSRVKVHDPARVLALDVAVLALVVVAAVARAT